MLYCRLPESPRIYEGQQILINWVFDKLWEFNGLNKFFIYQSQWVDECLDSSARCAIFHLYFFLDNAKINNSFCIGKKFTGDGKQLVDTGCDVWVEIRLTLELRISLCYSFSLTHYYLRYGSHFLLFLLHPVPPLSPSLLLSFSEISDFGHDRYWNTNFDVSLCGRLLHLQLLAIQDINFSNYYINYLFCGGPH